MALHSIRLTPTQNRSCVEEIQSHEMKLEFFLTLVILAYPAIVFFLFLEISFFSFCLSSQRFIFEFEWGSVRV